jgi:uncharacterized protein
MMRWAWLLGLAALAGCANSLVNDRYYTLRAQAPVRAAPALEPRSTSVSVGPVRIAEVIDRPQIVLRVAENRVRIVDGHRWAEPLKRAIPVVLVQNLARQLPAAKVAVHGEYASRDAELRVQLDVRRFESMPGEAVVLEGIWSVRRVADGAMRTGSFALREPLAGAGYEAIVAAHEQTLARLSESLADAAGELAPGVR